MYYGVCSVYTDGCRGDSANADASLMTMHRIQEGEGERNGGRRKQRSRPGGDACILQARSFYHQTKQHPPVGPRYQYALREGILVRDSENQSSSAKYTALHTPPSIHFGALRTLSSPLSAPDQPCGPVSCPRSEPTDTANEAASAASFHVISPPAAHGSPCSR